MSEAILWQPDERMRRDTGMARYMAWLAAEGYGRFDDWNALYRWSISEPEAFWRSIWRYAGLEAQSPPERMRDDTPMPGTRWLPGARLNFAANLLRHAGGALAERPAVTAYAEGREPLRRTGRELLADVGAIEAWLRAQGVGVGDRVAGLVSNGYEALVAMLATTSLGAIWSSASPDFGVQATEDRFGQIEPTVLVAVNGYGYGGKRFQRAEQIAALRERMPSVRRVLVIRQLDDAPLPDGEHYVPWDEALAAHRGSEPSFTPLPADHPVYILYSSGTTGRPKCIVHGAGNLLLGHARELLLHGDVQAGDRFFYFTTCGWMMWNWQASALLAGASLVVYDGSPGHPDVGMLWRLAADERLTHFGTSARFIAGCRKAAITPGRDLDLGALRVVFSTGSPLLPEDYDWFYEAVSQQVLLGSIAGGTDICGCFVGSNPLLPVRRGEIQSPFLGCDVVAYDDDGNPLRHERGELVCRQPIPSMPVAFWNDPDGARYRGAYFERFPGVWAHGDFVRFTESGGAVIYGRSDATLNPGGVRIGTAEIYRQVETMPEIADSIVAGRPVDGDVEVVLLVVPAEGKPLDEEQIATLRRRIRTQASPRHVPKHILQVDDIPYTRSGKKVELAVARLLQGERDVGNRGSLANPEAIDHLVARLEAEGLLGG
ncbi:acetoacetate--CoA ligase [Sediminicurvatus halobius]|uniref:Acetoacetate--CoA ligase n=1 Tax=Sediminicurvatus halobius TaxID=2182432 RepID=A0A2U2N8P8_9GAMM|nr:acetoacetate--CoA ligase [Spiribacter halobius]PWG65468.1 acetoacetate--CoA ligase [Spiribacter halobius]UEX76491.1 acetoacetate--CoA ligase [Spiribacter halobius]